MIVSYAIDQVLLEPISLNPVSVTEFRFRLFEAIGFDADVDVDDDDGAVGGAYCCTGELAICTLWPWVFGTGVWCCGEIGPVVSTSNAGMSLAIGDGVSMLPYGFVSCECFSWSSDNCVCQAEFPICRSSPRLTESGITLSASQPLDSFPGVCDGITNVTSSCGITHPKTIDLFDDCCNFLKILCMKFKKKIFNISNLNLIFFLFQNTIS